MVITVLADGPTAEAVGEMLATVAIPVAGLIMLVVGLTRRGRTSNVPHHRPWVHPGVGPQQPSPPPGPAAHWPPVAASGPSPSSGRLYPTPPPPYPSAVPNYPPPPLGGVPPNYPPPVPPGATSPVPHQRSGGTGLIVVGALLLIAGLVHVVSAQTGAHRAPSDSTGQSPSATAQKAGSNYPLGVGQCVTAANISSLMVWGAIPCDNEMASYELALKGDQTANCPDGERDHSMYTVLTKDDTTLCFAYNLIEGRCYVDGDTTTLAYTVASCSAPKAVKVVRRMDNSTAAGQCPAQSTAVVFPRPARLFCLAHP